MNEFSTYLIIFSLFLVALLMYVIYNKEKKLQLKNEELEELNENLEDMVRIRTQEYSKALEELSEIKSYYEQIIDVSPIPIFVKYTIANKFFLNMFGYNREEFIGKGVYELYDEDLADIYHQEDLKLLNSDGYQVYEGEVKDKDEKRHNVVFYKSIIYTQEGEVDGIVGVFMDITDRREAEERLIRLLS